jgi:heme A synthase
MLNYLSLTPLVSQGVTKDNRTNPWISGTFYLFALVVIIGIIIFLNHLSIPWIATVTFIVVALFALLIVATLQLRNDKNLSEESFTRLMLEVIKNLPLLRKN